MSAASRPSWRRGIAPVLLVVLVLTTLVACARDDLSSAAPGSTVRTGGPEPAPVDFSRRGPYPVGTVTLPVGATTAVVYYPADPASAASVRHSTSHNTADAYTPALRDSVTPLVPELALDIPGDVAHDAQINPEGPFPIVLHSHGLGGNNRDAAAHMQHLASWGFVAAAPEHTSRDVNAMVGNAVDLQGTPDVADLAETLRALSKENTRPGSPLLTGLDTTSVAAEGLDAGGRAAALFAASEPKVKLWIGLAPIALARPESASGDGTAAGGATGEGGPARTTGSNPPPEVPGAPSLVITGEQDTLIPVADVQAVYDALAPPKRLAVVKGAGHASFVDACVPVHRSGGLGRYAESLPALIPLLERTDDGCGPEAVDPAEAARYVDHLTIAQYRSVLGLDPSDVSLRDDYLRATFPDVFVPVQATPG